MRKSPGIIPFGFRPAAPEFKELLRDCSLPHVRNKFAQLAGLNPRAVRAEVGSASRLVDGTFGNPGFVRRCAAGFDLPGHLQRRGKLVLEADGANEDVFRLITGALSMRVSDHCETRGVPSPPVLVVFEEYFNFRLGGALMWPSLSPSPIG